MCAHQLEVDAAEPISNPVETCFTCGRRPPRPFATATVVTTLEASQGRSLHCDLCIHQYAGQP